MIEVGGGFYYAINVDDLCAVDPKPLSRVQFFLDAVQRFGKQDPLGGAGKREGHAVLRIDMPQVILVVSGCKNDRPGVPVLLPQLKGQSVSQVNIAEDQLGVR